jgi:hypothetical protein
MSSQPNFFTSKLAFNELKKMNRDKAGPCINDLWQERPKQGPCQLYGILTALLASNNPLKG